MRLISISTRASLYPTKLVVNRRLCQETVWPGTAGFARGRGGGRPHGRPRTRYLMASSRSGSCRPIRPSARLDHRPPRPHAPYSSRRRCGRRPRTSSRLPARVGQDVDEDVRLVDRHPVADELHPVLHEQGVGVLAEALVERLEPAGMAVVGAQFEDAAVRRDRRAGRDCRDRAGGRSGGRGGAAPAGGCWADVIEGIRAPTASADTNASAVRRAGNEESCGMPGDYNVRPPSGQPWSGSDGAEGPRNW